MRGTTKAEGGAASGGTRWWKVIRRTTQLAVVLLVGWFGLRHAQLFRGGPIDAYCPFGAIETLPKLIANGTFLQKTALSSMVIFGAVLGMSVVGRASFCGWLCPLGAIEDAVHWLGRLATRALGAVPGLGGPNGRLARWGDRRSQRSVALQSPGYRRLDQILRYGRYVVLGLIVVLTARVGSLVFANYDPFRVLFHFRFESWTGFVVLGLLLVTSVLIERFWCRYLCPLGAVVSLVSRLSPAGIVRNSSACVDCGRCDKACGLGLEVATVDKVTSGQCTLCVECVGSCPKDALQVTWGQGALSSLSARLRAVGPSGLRPAVRPLAAVAVFTLIVGAAMAGGAWQTRTGGGAGRASEAAGASRATEGSTGETDHAVADAPGTPPTSRSAAAPQAGTEKGGSGSQTASVDPQSITGMMTVDEVAQTFDLKPADILAALHAPETEDPSRPLREIAHQYGTEVSALREWLAERAR